jgi:spermidine synthase
MTLELPPNGQLGEACISETTVTYSDVLESLMDSASTGFPFHVQEGKYKRLHVRGVLQMSNTRMERVTNLQFVLEARGKVLVAGLGMGYVLTQILPKPEVKHVTVIEKSADVVKLVAPHFACDKLRVLIDDIHRWRPSEKFHVIYFDIWPNVSLKNLPEMAKLHRRFRQFLLPGGYLNSWSREGLLKMKKRGLE